MPRPLWRRLLGLGDPARADEALRQLLAARFPDPPSRDELAALLETYGLSGPAVRTLCVTRYAEAVSRAARDAQVEARELDYLRALRGVLTISEQESREAFARAAAGPVKRAIDAALADDLLSAAEKERLPALAGALQLPEETLLAWTREAALGILNRRAEALVADRRLSPDEERELHELARSLGGEMRNDAATQAVLDRYRLLWEVENGILPTIAVPITLHRGERCHAQVRVTWHEPRTRTTGVSYAGVGGSFRIAKGVRFRVGHVVPVRHTVDQLTPIDEGTLYVTDRRLILRGARGNKTVRLSAVLGVEVYGNGVEVQKAQGRPPFLEMAADDVEYAGAVIAGALAGSGGGALP